MNARVDMNTIRGYNSLDPRHEKALRAFEDFTQFVAPSDRIALRIRQNWEGWVILTCEVMPALVELSRESQTLDDRRHVAKQIHKLLQAANIRAQVLNGALKFFAPAGAVTLALYGALHLYGPELEELIRKPGYKREGSRRGR